jgi:hypothetical protein
MHTLLAMFYKLSSNCAGAERCISRGAQLFKLVEYHPRHTDVIVLSEQGGVSIRDRRASSECTRATHISVGRPLVQLRVCAPKRHHLLEARAAELVGISRAVDDDRAHVMSAWLRSSPCAFGMQARGPQSLEARRKWP